MVPFHSENDAGYVIIRDFTIMLCLYVLSMGVTGYEQIILLFENH